LAVLIFTFYDSHTQLFFFYLFLNAVLSSKCVSQKKFFFLGGREQKEYQDREIAPISLPPFYQWRVRERTGYAPGPSRECCTKIPA